MHSLFGVVLALLFIATLISVWAADPEAVRFRHVILLLARLLISSVSLLDSRLYYGWRWAV